MPIWLKALAATAIIATAGPCHAARDFTPQAGTWIVSSELDGKPGRGLAIDVQGNTFFMQVFGYEKNGDATFYTATGQMDGNGVTAPLMRYQGGRSFGGEARDAVEDKSLGDVTVSFRNGLKGTVQLPGEQPLSIERFLVSSAEPGVTNPRMQTGMRSLTFMVLDEQGHVAYNWGAVLTRTDNNAFKLVLSQSNKFLISSYYYEPFQALDCELADARAKWTCLPAGGESFLDPEGKPITGPKVDGLHFELAGGDLSGAVRVAGASAPISMPMTGRSDDASEPGERRRDGVTTWTTYIQQNYLPSTFSSSGACTLTCSGREYVNTLMPFNGTWIVEDELTGKPGRGLALDIQGNTAILQVYNYRANQQPSFHMGSAAYVSKGLNSLATVASIPLDEYAGGRSVGGALQSAQWHAHAGNAQLEFSYQKPDVSRPMEEWIWWTSGQLQLPGEQPVRIRRLMLDRPSSFAEDMLGTWFLNNVQTTVDLVRVEGDSVTTADGSVVCKPAISIPGQVNSSIHCSPSAEPGVGNWILDMRKPLMGRGGDMVRLRDRFGNAVGLGVLD